MFRQLASRQSRQIVARRFNSTQAAKLEGPAFPASNAEKAKAFKEHEEAVIHHSGSTTALWKKISLFVAAPAILLAAINTYGVEKEHAEHREHNKHLSDEEWPTAYPYNNIRRKDFFWGDGDKTLFWNPDVNRHVKPE